MQGVVSTASGKGSISAGGNITAGGDIRVEVSEPIYNFGGSDNINIVGGGNININNKPVPFIPPPPDQNAVRIQIDTVLQHIDDINRQSRMVTAIYHLAAAGVITAGIFIGLILRTEYYYFAPILAGFIVVIVPQTWAQQKRIEALHLQRLATKHELSNLYGLDAHIRAEQAVRG